jgi:hypothetical protein
VCNPPPWMDWLIRGALYKSANYAQPKSKYSVHLHRDPHELMPQHHRVNAITLCSISSFETVSSKFPGSSSSVTSSSSTTSPSSVSSQVKPHSVPSPAAVESVNHSTPMYHLVYLLELTWILTTHIARPLEYRKRYRF